MAARTRRQQAALAAQSDGTESPASNGTAGKSPKKTKTTAEKEVKENVYLFAPNLIGMELLLSPSRRRFNRSLPFTPH
jgi:CDP-diacylglycerol--inositol 3-phosphatidyltransferase